MKRLAITSFLLALGAGWAAAGRAALAPVAVGALGSVAGSLNHATTALIPR